MTAKERVTLPSNLSDLQAGAGWGLQQPRRRQEHSETKGEMIGTMALYMSDAKYFLGRRSTIAHFQ